MKNELVSIWIDKNKDKLQIAGIFLGFAGTINAFIANEVLMNYMLFFFMTVGLMIWFSMDFDPVSIARGDGETVSDGFNVLVAIIFLMTLGSATLFFVLYWFALFAERISEIIWIPFGVFTAYLLVLLVDENRRLFRKALIFVTLAFLLILFCILLYTGSEGLIDAVKIFRNADAINQ